jgi:hypothetical protein
MHSLRDRLQAMTEVEDVSQHAAILATIGRACPNTVQIVASQHPEGRYTCMMHVMEFVGSLKYEAIASKGFNVVFAGRQFAHWLLEEYILIEKPEIDVKEQIIVLYFANGRFMHAGLSFNRHRVISKWGTGHLYEHALWEVPQSYGDTVRFFKKPTCEEALNCFIRFARERGMSFKLP